VHGGFGIVGNVHDMGMMIIIIMGMM